MYSLCTIIIILICKNKYIWDHTARIPVLKVLIINEIIWCVMLQIFLKFASSIFLNQMIKIYSWLTHQTIIFQTISTELNRFCYILISANMMIFMLA